MFKIYLSFFCALGMFLFYGCASKYVAYPLYPRPYDTSALMWADLQVKEVNHLLQLVEERLHARTLEAYINVQDRINRKLASLIASIDVDAGIAKYGEPGFSNVERRAVQVLLEFSQISTADHLGLARQVVKDAKYNISNYAVKYDKFEWCKELSPVMVLLKDEMFFADSYGFSLVQ